MQGFALVVFMGVDTAGNDHIAVKVKPGKFAVVVIEEPRSQTDSLVGGYIGEGVVMVGTVEIIHMNFTDHTLLQGHAGRAGSRRLP